MLAALLITFREVFEAALIVATFCGILIKFNRRNELKQVWLAAGAAALVSVGLLWGGSLAGFQLHKVMTEDREELFEGLMMIISAGFITWAVFWLHKTFVKYKIGLLKKVRETVESQGRTALFWLVFVAVVREGIEIVLFLATMYLSETPLDLFTGFGIGAGVAILLAIVLFQTTIHLPIYRAFQITSLLLILFAAGLLIKGLGELAEIGWLPGLLTQPEWVLGFVPDKETVVGSVSHVIFGFSNELSWFQGIVYGVYILAMVKMTLIAREDHKA